MPVLIACTSCRAQFNVNESSLGKTLKCPKCQAVFQAAAVEGITGQPPMSAAAPPPLPGGGYQPGAPPAPPAYGSPPPSYGSYGAPPGYGVNIAQPGVNAWGSTLSGLNLLRMSSLVLLIATVLVSLLQVAAPADPFEAMQGGGMGGTQAIRGVLGCALLIFGVVAFVGMCMCLSAPYPTAKKRALTGFLLMIATFLVAIIGVVALVVFAAGAGFGALQGGNQLDLLMSVGVAGIAVAALIIGLGIAAWVFWMLFHAAIAECFQSSSLRSLSMTTLAVILAIEVLNIGIQLAVVFAESMAIFRVLGVWAMISNGAKWGLYFAVCNKSIAVIRGAR